MAGRKRKGVCKIPKDTVVGSGKVELPNFLEPDCEIYSHELFKAFYYVSQILIGLVFVKGARLLSVKQITEEMNKVTTADYSNPLFAVADPATNKEQLDIITKHDPRLACWYNFHSLILVSRLVYVVNIPLEELHNWQKECRRNCWYFLVCFYQEAATNDRNFLESDYLNQVISDLKGKKIFQKFEERIDKQDLYSLNAMIIPSNVYWFNIRYYLYRLSDDNDTDDEGEQYEDSDDAPIQSAKRRKPNGKQVHKTSALISYDIKIDPGIDLTGNPTDGTVLTNTELLHQMRRLSISNQFLIQRQVELLMIKQTRIERQMERDNKDHVKITNEIDYLWKNLLVEQGNLRTLLQSQVQTSANSPAIVDMLANLPTINDALGTQEDLRQRILEGGKYLVKKPTIYDFSKLIPTHLAAVPDDSSSSSSTSSTSSSSTSSTSVAVTSAPVVIPAPTKARKRGKNEKVKDGLTMGSGEKATLKVECKTPGAPTRVTRSSRRQAINETKTHPIEIGSSPDNEGGNFDLSDESNGDDEGDVLDNDNEDGNDNDNGDMEEGKELSSLEEVVTLLSQVSDGVQGGEQAAVAQGEEQVAVAQVAVAQVEDQVGDQVGNVQVDIQVGVQDANQVGVQVVEQVGVQVGDVHDGVQVGIVQDGVQVGIVQDGNQVGVVEDGVQVGVVQDGVQVGEVQDGVQVGEVQDVNQVGVVQDVNQVGNQDGIQDGVQVGNPVANDQVLPLLPTSEPPTVPPSNKPDRVPLWRLALQQSRNN